MLQTTTIVIIVLIVIVLTEAGFIIWLALANKENCKESYKVTRTIKEKDTFEDNTGVNALAARLQTLQPADRGGDRLGNIPALLRSANQA